MPTTVCLNAEFTTPDDARLSALDAGLQHAVGVFETLIGGCAASHAGTPADQEPELEGVWALDLDEHVERLCASARDLGLCAELSESGLARAIVQTIARSGMPRCRVRLTVTGGDLNLLSRDGQRRPSEPTVLVVAQPATLYPPAMLQRGVTLALAGTRANPLNRFESHKTLNYWWRLSELQLAGAKGAGEALVFDVRQRLVGGCVSNCLLVKDGEVFTPPTRAELKDTDEPSATLPGITRAWIIHELAGLGTVVRVRDVGIDDVLGADEVMLTNSSWGVLPAVRLEARTIGAGAPGKITLDLADRWRRHVSAAAGEGVE